MKIGILVAMEKELKLLLPQLNDMKEVDLEGFKMYSGSFGNHQLTVAQCGIGKVNAALTAFALIRGFAPDLVINSGVAGGAGNGVRIGQLLVADYVAYHDVWCGPGTELGAADGCAVFLPADEKAIDIARRLLPADQTVFGLICSGDRFISRAEEVRDIKKNFPSVKAVDMESAAIAQVCSMRGVPFNILRVVSDTPGEGENISQYQDFWTKAPEETFKAVATILKEL